MLVDYHLKLKSLQFIHLLLFLSLLSHASLDSTSSSIATNSNPNQDTISQELTAAVVPPLFYDQSYLIVAAIGAVILFLIACIYWKCCVTLNPIQCCGSAYDEESDGDHFENRYEARHNAPESNVMGQHDADSDEESTMALSAPPATSIVKNTQHYGTPVGVQGPDSDTTSSSGTDSEDSDDEPPPPTTNSRVKRAQSRTSRFSYYDADSDVSLEEPNVRSQRSESNSSFSRHNHDNGRSATLRSSYGNGSSRKLQPSGSKVSTISGPRGTYTATISVRSSNPKLGSSISPSKSRKYRSMISSSDDSDQDNSSAATSGTHSGGSKSSASLTRSSSKTSKSRKSPSKTKSKSSKKKSSKKSSKIKHSSSKKHVRAPSPPPSDSTTTTSSDDEIPAEVLRAARASRASIATFTPKASKVSSPKVPSSIPTVTASRVKSKHSKRKSRVNSRSYSNSSGSGSSEGPSPYHPEVSTENSTELETDESELVKAQRVYQRNSISSFPNTELDVVSPRTEDTSSNIILEKPSGRAIVATVQKSSSFIRSTTPVAAQISSDSSQETSDSSDSDDSSDSTTNDVSSTTPFIGDQSVSNQNTKSEFEHETPQDVERFLSSTDSSSNVTAALNELAPIGSNSSLAKSPYALPEDDSSSSTKVTPPAADIDNALKLAKKFEEDPEMAGLTIGRASNLSFDGLLKSPPPSRPKPPVKSSVGPKRTMLRKQRSGPAGLDDLLSSLSKPLPSIAAITSSATDSKTDQTGGNNNSDTQSEISSTDNHTDAETSYQTPAGADLPVDGTIAISKPRPDSDSDTEELAQSLSQPSFLAKYDKSKTGSKKNFSESMKLDMAALTGVSRISERKIAAMISSSSSDDNTNTSAISGVSDQVSSSDSDSSEYDVQSSDGRSQKYNEKPKASVKSNKSHRSSKRSKRSKRSSHASSNKSGKSYIARDETSSSSSSNSSSSSSDSESKRSRSSRSNRSQYTTVTTFENTPSSPKPPVISHRKKHPSKNRSFVGAGVRHGFPNGSPRTNIGVGSSSTISIRSSRSKMLSPDSNSPRYDRASSPGFIFEGSETARHLSPRSRAPELALVSAPQYPQSPRDRNELVLSGSGEFSSPLLQADADNFNQNRILDKLLPIRDIAVKLEHMISTAPGIPTPDPFDEFNRRAYFSKITETDLYQTILSDLKAADPPMVASFMSRFKSYKFDEKQSRLVAELFKVFFDWRFIKALQDTPNFRTGKSTLVSKGEIYASYVKLNILQNTLVPYIHFTIANALNHSMTLTGLIHYSGLDTLFVAVLRETCTKFIRDTISPVLYSLLNQDDEDSYLAAHPKYRKFKPFEVLPAKMSGSPNSQKRRANIMMTALLEAMHDNFTPEKIPPAILQAFHSLYSQLLTAYRNNTTTSSNKSSIHVSISSDGAAWSKNVVFDAPRYISIIFFHNYLSKELFSSYRNGLLKDPPLRFRRSVQIISYLFSRMALGRKFSGHSSEVHLQILNPLLEKHFESLQNLTRKLYILPGDFVFDSSSAQDSQNSRRSQSSSVVNFSDSLTVENNILPILQCYDQNLFTSIPVSQTLETSCIFARFEYLLRKLPLGFGDSTAKLKSKKSMTLSRKTKHKSNRLSGFF